MTHRIIALREKLQWYFCLMAAGLFVNAFAAQSAGAVEVSSIPDQTAHQFVEVKTEELIGLITEAQGYYDEDPQRFNKSLEAMMVQFVDFKSFARGVMGKYAGRKRIESLDEAGRAKLIAQIGRFQDVFQTALIDTYGKGLLVFEGERVEVVAPTESANKGPDRALVKQLIHGERDKPYVIVYSMKRSKAGDWKVRNMIIESSNLGKIYRNQFYNAYQVYEGDIDKVIDSWVVSS